MAIFNSPRGRCVACHSGAELTDRRFHNIGVGFDGPYRPDRDLGRFAVTGKDEDYGSFKTPTLQNVERTAPYMHDGSLATLEEVVAFYNQGGHPNANLDPRIGKLNLNAEEQAAMVAFLKAFTAPDNLKDMGKLPGIHNPKTVKEPLTIPAELLR
ncbi:Cytochrome c551 peroxidase precursor [compost metagenome]